MLIFVLAGGSGCAVSPWKAAPAATTTATTAGENASPGSPPAANAPASPPAAATQATTSAAAGPQTTASTPTAKPRPDPQAVDDLVAKIAERESLDAPARTRLAEDLRQTDPALWPALMQYFQAALAYRRQAEQRETTAELRAETQERPSKVSSSVSDQEAAAAPPAPLPGDSRATGALAQTPRAESRPTRSRGRSTVRLPPVAPEEREATASERPSRLASDHAARLAKDERPSEKVEARGASHGAVSPEGVVPASYVVPGAASPDQWQDRLDSAIKLMEAEARQSPQTSAEVARQARLRLLYLAAGRRDDALRPLASVSPAMQDSWSQMLFGLATLIDTERITDPSRRASETRQQLIAAANRLGELAPLTVRNLSLVKQVKSFGDVVPFEKSEFTPGQEVLLYVELENFKSEETPKGFHTQFRGSYEVFDSRDQRVATQELGKTEETCRNRRRDFFLIYALHLPKRIYSGKHTLKLTIEDLNRQEIGQASLEFTIKAGAD